MRKLWLGIIGLAAASTANAAVVTYTLSLHETAAGAKTALNNFVVYATVEPGTNDGLFAFGVDLEGTFTALTNRSPNGFYAIDDTSPSWDSTVAYPPAQYVGWGAGRGASLTTGIVSGVPDLNKDPNLKRIFKYGQQSGTVTVFKPADFTNPPDSAEHPGEVVPWKYNNDPGADLTYGTPSNPVGASIILPPGTVRLGVGTWTGANPTIASGINFPNTKASVWRSSHPLGTENDIAQVLTQTRDLNAPTGQDLAQLATTAAGTTPTNVAVGGGIAVTGSNGKYVSEVDLLTADSVLAGNAPIQTIGDESGFVYVMAKLNGDVAGFLNSATITNDVDATDSQFAALHQNYDALFPGGSFNALFRFPSFAGAKIFSIETDGSTHGAVSVDALAAVPEPASLGLLGVAGLAMLGRRRRKA